MQCTRCGKEYGEAYEECTMCGEPNPMKAQAPPPDLAWGSPVAVKELAQPCSFCGEEVRAGSPECPNCGNILMS
jgi:hypothetical protein